MAAHKSAEQRLEALERDAVPREPTPEMIEAGSLAYAVALASRNPGTKAFSWHIWRAMWDTAREGQNSEPSGIQAATPNLKRSGEQMTDEKPTKRGGGG